MLPEKKKNLIISLIAIVILVIVILLIVVISNLVKLNNKRNGEKTNDDYLNLYTYYGITKNEDDIYQIYGINSEGEKYLDIRTFYDVVDARIINNRILLYSDAVNEVRYDEYKKEFYLYEVDNYFSNNKLKYLGNDYLIIKDDSNIRYSKYGNNMEKYLEINNSSSNILVNKNKIYYAKEDGIYEYNLEAEEENQIATKEGTINLWKVTDKYLYFYQDNILYYIDISNRVKTKIMIEENYLPIDIFENGILFLQNNKLNKYVINNNIVSLDITGTIEKSSNLDNNIYYMKLNGENVIIDIEKNEVIKKLDEDYIYVLKGE